RERRSGTPNVAGIVGFATALKIIDAERAATTERVARLRDRLLTGLMHSVPGLSPTISAIHGKPPHGDSEPTVVSGSCHVCIEGVDSESLLLLLEMGGVMASAGSSCASGAQEESHVLVAMGVSEELARGALRLSLGTDTTDADVDLVLEVLPKAVERVKAFG
ncbi:MAG TPA: aminotransferase class V-fold PLP-dependent enzyme, partial [Microthrixaceae bacterium]|nr:aminotransferase class V-fold PLP-dependent enzyme [Microthrixaceae bacterium]